MVRQRSSFQPEILPNKYLFSVRNWTAQIDPLSSFLWVISAAPRTTGSEQGAVRVSPHSDPTTAARKQTKRSKLDHDLFGVLPSQWKAQKRTWKGLNEYDGNGSYSLKKYKTSQVLQVNSKTEKTTMSLLWAASTDLPKKEKMAHRKRRRYPCFQQIPSWS